MTREHFNHPAERLAYDAAAIGAGRAHGSHSRRLAAAILRGARRLNHDRARRTYRERRAAYTKPKHDHKPATKPEEGRSMPI